MFNRLVTVFDCFYIQDKFVMVHVPGPLTFAAPSHGKQAHLHTFKILLLDKLLPSRQFVPITMGNKVNIFAAFRYIFSSGAKNSFRALVLKNY
jgi:hypothetical protein